MSAATRLFKDEDLGAAQNFDIIVYGRYHQTDTEDGAVPFPVIWRGQGAAWGKAPDGDFIIQRRINLDADHPVLIEAAVFSKDCVSFIEPQGFIIDLEKFIEDETAQREAQAAAQAEAGRAQAAQVLGLNPAAAVGPNRAARRKG